MKMRTNPAVLCLLLLLSACVEETRQGDSSPSSISTVDSALLRNDSSDSTTQLQPRPVVLRESDVVPATESRRKEKETASETAPRFEALLAGLLPPPQQFSIRTDRDTVLRCAQGTLLRLPAGSFVDAAGKPVSGVVTVELEEFYSTADILAAGLHTQSGDRALETGGMIYWTARSAGAEVQVARDARASVGFPAKGAREGMQLFAGVERNGRLDWEAAEEGTAVVAPAYIPARYPGGSGALANVFERFIDPTEIIMPGERRKYTVFLRVDESGYGSVLRITPEAAPGLRQSVASALRGAARWTPAQRMGMPVSDTCLHYLDFSWTIVLPQMDSLMPHDTTATTGRPRSVKQDPAPARAAVAENYEPSVQETMRNMEYYMMSSLSTGWVNCDRFINDPRPRVEFVLNGDPAKEDVRALFTSTRTFVQGGVDAKGRYRLTDIPSGERLMIIAIRKEHQQVNVAFADARAGDPPPALVYKPMTVGDIRRKIQSLNGR